VQNQYLLTPYFLDERVPGLDDLAADGWRENRPTLPAGEKQERMTALHKPLAALVAEAVAQGKRPVSVAGDCCTTIGVMAGLQRAGLSPALIWFDAHGDFNDWETSPSGFLGGMPLAMLAGIGEQTMPQGVGLQSVPAADIVLVDGRDLDPGERKLVEQSGIIHLPDITTLLDYPLPDGPLYVHFDTDVIDMAEVPAMNYPAANGPSAETVRRVWQKRGAARPYRSLPGTRRWMVTAVPVRFAWDCWTSWWGKQRWRGGDDFSHHTHE
jgi:arginase